MSDLSYQARLYQERFDAKERQQKLKVWQALCESFFQRYVSPGDTVLDLGAGYCEFINNIKAKERIAVDSNPELQRYAGPGVQAVVSSATELEGIESETVDIVFVSNFFEHLPNKGVFLQCLRQIRRVLREGGRLLVLQPNIRAVGAAYWDFFDHQLPLNEQTLIEALSLINLDVLEVRARFLPYTTKSRLPKSALLVRLYLMFPLIHRFLGGQAFVVGVKRHSSGSSEVVE